jgi:hypothetical protein
MEPEACPRCGTMNPPNAMNCRQCRINLEFAKANPEVAQGLTRDIRTRGTVEEFLPSKRRYFSRVALLLVIVGLVSVIVWGDAALGGFFGSCFRRRARGILDLPPLHNRYHG